MPYGLSKRDINTIRQIFIKYPEVRNVSIFGSRALGTNRPGSDIDLAILDENISPTTLRRIISDFEESSLAYKVDVLHYPSLEHTELRDHINRVGKLLTID